MRWRDRGEWFKECAFVLLSMMMGLIMLLVMVYIIYECNKLTPTQRAAQGYKEWVVKGE